MSKILVWFGFGAIWFRFLFHTTKNFGFDSKNKILNRTKTDQYVLNIIMHKIFQEHYH